jgi:sarcosine oxidase, subunit beta
MAGATVVVVGGGVMGCSIAFHLAERGVDTLVLERGTVCSGMTARSGALVRMHYTNEPEARMALTGLGYFRDWRERVGG